MKPYYEDDAVTIYHGDCRDVLDQISGVVCVVTSPPYNQMAALASGKASGLWADRPGGAGFVEAWANAGYSDDMDEAAYQSWQNHLFRTIGDRCCTPDASMFYNHQVRWRDGVCLHPVQWFTPLGWNLRQEIIWDRAGGMMFNARMFCRFDERVMWFVRGKAWRWNQSAVGLGTIWRIPREQRKEHPVAYPIDLAARCIVATTDPGDVVLDPFMGSGSTLVAAKNLGRKSIGIEKEERWCALAVERLAQNVLDLGVA